MYKCLYSNTPKFIKGGHPQKVWVECVKARVRLRFERNKVKYESKTLAKLSDRLILKNSAFTFLATN